MILLTSDTETRPTPAMRRAIAAAEVGDEQRGEDPSVNRLQERVADLLGKEAGLFLPSGTMCNLIAVRTHAEAGQVMFAERDAHVLRAEGGGAALVSGVLADPIDGERGIFDAQAFERAYARATALPPPWGPKPRLLCVEQTHNVGGGAVWPVDKLDAVCAAAHHAGLRVHMDGARLMNAVIASGAPAARFCAGTDSAWLDFTKGLGAPIGAVLAGSRAFIDEARRFKHLFGGAMRQAGIAAAGCLYALDAHVERLAEDHANARRLAEGLAAIDGIALPLGMPETNIVFFDPRGTGKSPAQICEALLARGVRMVPMGSRVRAVTHLDVSTEQIDEAIAAVSAVC